MLGLRDALARHGYTEEALERLYAPYGWPVQASGLWAVLRDLDDSPFALLVRLFAFSLWTPLESVREALGKALLDRLVYWGILALDGERVAATVDISCCQGLYLLTDHLIGIGRRPDSVYPVSADSLALARLTPRGRVMRALDLCTGSGLHALLAARHSFVAEAVDLSPRALEFVRFNAALNGLTVRCHSGNCFDSLPPARYDLITANPPWVPTPDSGIELYRGGGEDGQAVTSALVKALPERLAPGGWLAMYVEYPSFAGQTYLQRVRAWLGEGHWGLALLDLQRFSAQQYALAHVMSHSEGELAQELERWMQCYDRVGIEAMTWAMLYVTPSDIDWNVVRQARLPERAQDWVDDWLALLARPLAPRRWPGMKVYRETESGELVARWPETNLSDVSLSEEQFQALQRLEGTRELAALNLMLR